MYLFILFRILILVGLFKCDIFTKNLAQEISARHSLVPS